MIRPPIGLLWNLSGGAMIGPLPAETCPTEIDHHIRGSVATL
jgi:hypothetical protein